MLEDASQLSKKIERISDICHLLGMIVDQIKERLTNGFHPFTLHMSDGKRFAVPHRDFIALATRVIVVIDEREIAHTLNPLHVVSIEDSAGAVPAR